MSDESVNPPEDPSPQGAAGEPPHVPPVVPPDPTIIETVFESRPPKRKPLAYAAVVIGLIALAGGAIFFARSVGTTSGAATPEAAVQRMFDALSNEDLLGVLEVLHPAERSILSNRIKTASKELGRLKVLSSDLDLGDVRGIDLSFTGLTYRTASLDKGIAAVVLTAGRASYRVDPAASPLGEFVRGFMSGASNRVQTGSDDIGRDQPVFVALQHDGTWFVSLGYSIAEQARRDAGLQPPAFGQGVPARGASSPEEAVDQFLRAAARLDIRRLIELLPNGEAGALHDYAPLFLADVEKVAAGARKQFRMDFRTLDLSADNSGNEALVTIDKIAFGLSIPELGITADYDGTCFKAEGIENFLGSNPGPICGKGISGLSGIPNLPTPKIGIVVVRENGSWYVSPLGTWFDAMNAVFKALQPSHLEIFKQFFGFLGGIEPPTGGGGGSGYPPGFPTSIPLPYATS
jgi:hypothetical protein